MYFIHTNADFIACSIATFVFLSLFALNLLVQLIISCHLLWPTTRCPVDQARMCATKGFEIQFNAVVNWFAKKKNYKNSGQCVRAGVAYTFYPAVLVVWRHMENMFLRVHFRCGNCFFLCCGRCIKKKRRTDLACMLVCEFYWVFAIQQIDF